MKQFIPLICCLGVSFSLKANCVFDGTVGASQVVGEVTLAETQTPDGSEIELGGKAPFSIVEIIFEGLLGN